MRTHLVVIGAPLVVLVLVAGRCGPGTTDALLKGAAEGIESVRGTAGSAEGRGTLAILEHSSGSADRVVGGVFADVPVSSAKDELLQDTGCAALQHIRDTNELPTFDDWVGYLQGALVGHLLRVADVATGNALFDGELEAFAGEVVADDGNIYRGAVDSVYDSWSCGRSPTPTDSG